MGIRLDQLHSEVFAKINADLTTKSTEFADYIDTKISEIDVVYGLPETTQVAKDAEINKRNLEKSGFIEINRNFVPIKNGDQASTGVWISNLETNESPFEPQTIDGQKRGISIAGHNFNYTKGNIGQEVDKMMQLPIAPNLPVFFPENNDMVFKFQPKKSIEHETIVTDNAIEVTITDRITDENKIEISSMVDGDKTIYYYMDEDSNMFYLNDDGRSYLQNDPNTLLVEPYNRFTTSFGGAFTFEKFFNADAKAQFIDISNGSKIFDIVSPKSTDASKIELKTDDNSNVYLTNMTVTRFVPDENGDLVSKEFTNMPMLVKNVITTTTIDGKETEILTKEVVSQEFFDVATDENNNKFISDEGINMFLDADKIYSYHPYSKKVLDADGKEQKDADGNFIVEIDERYTKYIAYADITDTNAMTVNVVDNINNNTVARNVLVEDVEKVTYYKIYTKMVANSNTEASTLDANGDYAQSVDASRNITMTDDNKLSSINTAGDAIIYSAGKEFYYYPTVGTKYYKTSQGDIYFIDSKGTLYLTDNDVQEILKGNIYNKDTFVTINTMFYVANGLTFYIDSENLRSYILDEQKQEIQLTDVNGYRVYIKEDGTKVYIYVDSADTLKMVTIDDQGVEHSINVSYKEITPLFETESVLEDVLNLVIPVDFNIVQGDIELTRNNQELHIYSDYEVEGILTLAKPLEFNEDTNKGDTLYVKRVGKKDIILRLEKTGTQDNDINGDWANDKGQIVIPEPLTGNYFNWTDGQELLPGEELDFNDIVKKDDKFYQYTGTAISYADLPDTDKAIHVNVGGVFWDDVTVDELEWERKNNNYKILNADKGDTIRFTVINRIWETDQTTGEKVVSEKAPYTIEKQATNDGANVFVIDDANFNFDNNPNLESYILVIENIKTFGTYENNRANDFKLTLTGLQTVAVNEDPAMIYGEGYFLSDNILILKDADINDEMALIRYQAPQAELKIEFIAETEQPKVTVPFDIIKNKFDIVVPQVLDGHEYTWIMGEYLPEGKTLMTGDIIFDKENIKFYKYIGQTKTKLTADGPVPVPKESLLRQSEEIQKELSRQFLNIPADLNPGKWFSNFDIEWSKRADSLAQADGLNLQFFTQDVNGNDVLNTTDSKVSDYLRKAREAMILDATNALNDAAVDAMETTSILTDAVKAEIKRVLNTDLDQFVLKKIKYGDDNQPVLDEDGNIVYYYEYTRSFMVETNENSEFITRNIHGAETTINNMWEDITAPHVGYYRFGKTFTILDTKAKDQVVVRLLSTGAEVFTSKSVISEGGEITFAIDFNIENDDGSEIPFEVVYEELNWIEGLDYIQEGQELILTMVEKPGQKVIIRRNDEFDLGDIVILERKDLVFIETWHEAVSETDFIFPFGNVQYQGTTANGIPTSNFDHVFYDTIDGETSVIPNGNIRYCQAFEKGSIVYNYYAGTEFDPVTDEEKAFIDKTFKDDTTVGKGWKLSELTDEERTTIFNNSDHNLYFDGEKLIQIRYRTRVVALNLFNNYFKGTSPYMSEGLRFQGSSPVTSRIVTREKGEDAQGKPITERIQIFAGGTLIQASNENSLLYKEGKLFDDALFTVEEPTELSYDGYVHAIPVAIINRRNQGVYHPNFNDNGTSFFINGIHVSEDKKNFDDDITGFTLVDETKATLETSSVGRDRKAKFKVMLAWLFSEDYKAGGSMVSKTTYRPDGLLYDEINTKDIIDLRIDANDQRKRLEDLESNLQEGMKELMDFEAYTGLRFDQTTSYINTTANLIYSHITQVESSVRKDMNDKDRELEDGLERTNTNLADLSANVFTKDITTNLLIDTIVGLTDYNKNTAFNNDVKPTREEISGMVNAFVENMEGPYTKSEFNKFLVTVLKLVVDKYMLSDDELDRWIRRLAVKDLSLDAETEIYTRAESLELIYEGMVLASNARVLPPMGSDKLENWAFSGKRYNGWLGTKHIDLKRDFIDTTKKPVATKEINVTDMTKSYTDRYGKVWNAGYLAGPTIWGDVHNYHAIYTAWIFVSSPFELDHIKMNGDDSHALYINGEVVATNKYCCRNTAYSYNFSVAGWYRLDAVYTERNGGHYMQFGWNPKDYTDHIKYMTTKDMDEQVRVTKLRIDNWSTKTKNLVSTIKGDATGYFTKLETKVILIEGLQRIEHNILEKGISITEEMIKAFNTGDETNTGLEAWLDNINPSDPGKFTAIDPNFVIQEGTDENGNKYPRSDVFRPSIDMTGSYNKDEVTEIIRKVLELSNGIDSIDSSDIQKWVDRLDIEIDMQSGVRYFTTSQVDRLIKDGTNYLAGMDKVTSYDISAWLDNHLTNYNLTHGGTDTDRIYHDANGVDLSVTDASQAYTKEQFKVLIATKFKEILGAQAAKTSN